MRIKDSAEIMESSFSRPGHQVKEEDNVESDTGFLDRASEKSFLRSSRKLLSPKCLEAFCFRERKRTCAVKNREDSKNSHRMISQRDVEADRLLRESLLRNVCFTHFISRARQSQGKV